MDAVNHLATEESICRFLATNCAKRPGDRTKVIGGISTDVLKQAMRDAGTGWKKCLNLAFASGEKSDCRNYLFGCSAPLDHGDEINTEMVRNRIYRNELVAIQKCADKKFVELYASDPEYSRLKGLLAELYAQKDSAETTVNAKRVESRSKKDDRRDIITLKDIDRDIAFANSQMQARKSQFKNEQWFLDGKREIELCKRMSQKELNLSYKSGGGSSFTRSMIQRSNPEQFREWDGSSTIVRQVASDSSLDKHMKLIPVTDEDRSLYRGRIPRGATHIAELKVANIGTVRFGVNFHREIPNGMVPKTISIVRTSTGRFVRDAVSVAARQYRWSIMITLEDKMSVVASKTKSMRSNAIGSVAIDVGWRRVDDHRLKVLVWAGDDGRSGEILLPQLIEDNLDAVNEHKSSRSIAVNRMRKLIAEYLMADWDFLPAQVLDCLRRRDGELPSVNQACCYVESMRSDRKLKYLALTIERYCTRSPNSWIVRQITNWVREDGQYQSAVPKSKRVTKCRSQFYQMVVNAFIADYKNVIVESLNLAQIGKKSELHEKDNAAVRSNKTIASIGKFLEKIRPYAVIVDARNTSRTCSYCGIVQNISAGSVHTCGNCNETWDRDLNACRNLLARAEVMQLVTLRKDWSNQQVLHRETDLSKLSSQSEWEQVF
jgi:hypothetical protein